MATIRALAAMGRGSERHLRTASRHMRGLVDSTMHEIHITVIQVEGGSVLGLGGEDPLPAHLNRAPAALLSLLQRLRGVLRRVHTPGLVTW